MNTHKVLFAGPVGAGKSTSIATISDIPPFVTEEYVTDSDLFVKPSTTVAMDYGSILLENGDRIDLYGVPGEVRFDFMWDILTEGGIGLVLLLNNQSEHSLEELEFYLDCFEEFIEQTGVAVGITRLQAGKGLDVDDYATVLLQRGLKVPVMEVDVRDR